MDRQSISDRIGIYTGTGTLSLRTYQRLDRTERRAQVPVTVAEPQTYRLQEIARLPSGIGLVRPFTVNPQQKETTDDA